LQKKKKKKKKKEDEEEAGEENRTRNIYIYMGWLLAYSGVLVPNDAKVPVKKVFCVHKVNY